MSSTSSVLFPRLHAFALVDFCVLFQLFCNLYYSPANASGALLCSSVQPSCETFDAK